MKKDEYEIIRRAREYLRDLGSGYTREQLWEETDKAYPVLWTLISPGLQAKWAWETRRAAKEQGTQLPLDGLFDDVVIERSEWEEDQYIIYAKRYDAAAKANARKRDLLKAEYYRKYHVQLTLEEATSEHAGQPG